jgi:hypothetical protein
VRVQKCNWSRGGRLAIALLTGLMATSIGLLTLWPMPGDASPGGPWCFGCGSIGTIDLLNNILLFAPLGALLAARTWSLARAATIGFLFSLGIEILQFAVIPGRDASLSDLLLNGTGTAAGWMLFASAAWWSRPSPSSGRWLALSAAGGFVSVLAGTGWLLQPSAPLDPLFGQWAPKRPPLTQYRGQLLSFEIAGYEVPHSPVPDPNGVRAAILRRAAVAQITTLPALPPDEPGALIGRLVAVDNEMFMFAQRGDALLGRFRLRSSDFRLRTLALSVPAALRPNERVRVEGGYDGASLVLRVVRPEGIIERELPLRVSLGWAFVRPAEITLGTWQRWVSGAWVALLALPLGFYAASATRRAGDARGWTLPTSLAVAASTVVLGLAGAPWLTSASPSAWTDWGGAVLGILAGWLARGAIRGAGTSAARGATDGPGRA